MIAPFQMLLESHQLNGSIMQFMRKLSDASNQFPYIYAAIISTSHSNIQCIGNCLWLFISALLFAIARRTRHYINREVWNGCSVSNGAAIASCLYRDSDRFQYKLHDHNG
eukprot:1073316_1